MTQQLTPNDKELYKRIDEVAHYIWDPIGVCGIPEARDEYDSYLWSLFANAKACNEDGILQYMKWVEEERMGLRFNQEKAKEAAGVMINWAELIYERA